MRSEAPFQADDLAELDARLFSRAERVVPMRDVFKGDRGERVIGLRHDVDDNPGSFETALRLAEWEFERGYSSTYFLLHDSHYWGEDMLCRVQAFEDLGHEVGLHVNAIAEGLRQAREPHDILSEALSELRAAGVRVVGTVAHGDNLCHTANFVNDELFSECARKDYGKPNRHVHFDGVVWQIRPMSRRAYELEYDANWLSRRDYLSDSGGKWSQPFSAVVQRFGEGQLHMLIHPDWWGGAFAPVEVTA
jgi:hypothetical protein